MIPRTSAGRKGSSGPASGGAGSNGGGQPRRLRAALRYHRLGLKVIKVQGKNPDVMGKGWEERPTTEADLPAWFGNGQAFNLGVQLGEVSGNLVDVDLDTPAAVAVAGYFLPATPWVFGRKGHPRSHREYRVDRARATVRFKDPVKGKGKKATLVEVRGNNSQTVFPPSTHEGTGEPIEWEDVRCLNGEPAHAAWSDLARAARLAAAAALLATYWPGEGARHDCALALGGGLARSPGWTAERAARFVEAVCAAAGDEEAADRVRAVRDTFEAHARGQEVTGWPTLAECLGEHGEVITRKVAEWVGVQVRFGGGPPPGPPPWADPVPLPEVPGVAPFPTALLPGPVADLVTDGAQALCCPPDYLGVPALVVAGAAAGASRCVLIKQNWRERPALYAAVVGPPGSVKSPALKLAAAPLYAEQARLHRLYRQQREAFEEDPEGERPRELVRYVSDVTVEKLAEVLQENPRGVAMVRDELTAWAASMNQYKARGVGADRQFFLSAWAGEPVSVRRKGDRAGPVFVPHPFLSIVGGLPPGLLPRLRGERDVDDGFMDRLLFAYPDPPRAAAENWECVTDDVCEAWAGVLRKLWGLQQQEGEHGPYPRDVPLSDCGRAAWECFTGALAGEVNAEDFPDVLRGPWSKMRGYCARLALVVHLVRWAAGEAEEAAVDGESVERAAELVAYFQSHARRVYATMGADRTLEDARRALRWLGQFPDSLNCLNGPGGERRVRKADLHSAVFGGRRTVEDVDRVTELLVRHGYLRPAAEDTRSGPGRRPGVLFEVYPGLAAGG
jgi:hypothetical protein